MSLITTLARAEAVATGRATPLATVRHRHLSERPLVLVPLTTAGEVGAPLGALVGTVREEPRLLVVPQPRDRDLRFAFLSELAQVVLPYVEGYADEVEVEPATRNRVGAPPSRQAGGESGERPRRLSEPELELLEQAAAMFREWDGQQGGGLRRKAVVGQLHEVTDLLQEPHPERVTRRLYRIAADLAALAGWMSYDIGLQPTAQKYFVLALHAAKEAEDRPLGAFVLSSMSRQMIHLNRPDDALDLVHLAQYGSRDTAGATTQAMLHAVEARAYANMGQVTKCHRAVRMAEDTFAESRRSEDPGWISFFNEAELNAENAHSYRDLAYVAGGSATYASLAHPVMERAVELFSRDEVHQRAYALSLVGMATVHLLEREPEQAAQLAGQAIDLARKLRSERVNTRIRKTVDGAVREFGDVGDVVRLTERLAVHLPEVAETA
jgi:hypothetical protein